MEGNSRTINVIKNISIGATTQILSLILSFLLRTVFIITLGNEYLSVNGLFTNILTLLTFSELGIGSAIIYSLYRPLTEDNYEQCGKLINLFAKAYRYIAIVIFVLGISIMPFLDYIVNDVPNVQENIYYLYFLFLLNTVCSYVLGYKKSLLIADQKNYIVISIHMVLNIIQVVIQIISLYLLKDYIVYLWVMIGFTLLNNVVSTSYVNHKYQWIKTYENSNLSRFDRDNIFQNVKNIIVYKVGTVVLNSSSSIIISTFIRTTLVGICSNYTMVINAVFAIINQGLAGLSASIGNYNVVANANDNENVFHQLVLLSFWGVGLSSILLGCMLNPLIYLWLGKCYLLQESVVFSLVLGFYAMLINSIPSSYRTAMGLFREARFAPLGATILNVGLSIIGVKFFGLFGVFFASFLSRILTYCVIDPYFVFKNGFKSNPKKYYITFLIRLVIFCLIYYASINAINGIQLQYGWRKLIVSFIIGFIFFNLSFVILYYKNPYLRMALCNICKNLCKR